MSSTYGSPGDRPEWLEGISESAISSYLASKDEARSPGSRQVSIGLGTSPDFEGAAARQSKNNRTSCDTEPELPENGYSRRYWWQRKNALVDECLDVMPGRMARPAAVRKKQKLREDCVRYEGDSPDDAENARSKNMTEVVREFLSWYNEYRFSHLLFNDPDGETVRAPLENSHQPEYGNRYYAKFKGLERRMFEEYDNPQTCILSLSGSSRNENGHYRCIVDHLRDVIDSWRPDRGRGVYHALREALDVDNVDSWEYAIAVEHHESGYGHVHIGIFADGELNEKMFRPVIDKHLEVCGIAHRSGHDYYHDDPDKKPISVNKLRRGDNVNNGSDDVAESGINNMASYLAEYIGANDGTELFDRSPEEILFRAASWSSTTQRVRFSNGANEMIRRDYEAQGYHHGAGTDVVSEVGGSWAPGTTKEMIQEAAADPDRSPAEYLERIDDGGSWSLAGVGRVDDDGETVYEVENKSVRYIEIDGAESLDPPKKFGPEVPVRSTENAAVDAYTAGDDD